MPDRDPENRIDAAEPKAAGPRGRLEQAQLLAAVRRGLYEADKGMCRPAREVVPELRIKHKLART